MKKDKLSGWRLYIKCKPDGKLTVDWALEEHAAEIEKLDCFVQWVDEDANIVKHPKSLELVERIKEWWREKN